MNALRLSFSRMALTLNKPKIILPTNTLHCQLSLRSFATKKKDIRTTWGKTKVASKRKNKNYKLKNHKGALARWLIVGNNHFKRSKCGRSHLNRKNTTEKKKRRRVRLLATTVESRLLRHLIPYYKRKSVRR
ncbi:hypothetical protein BC833DRAFT_621908 [Globomyces pollinis-pini]|nr:hypothetical protein BC833DRAFT_621908 [Globomyces pollinis-pini]KAJ2995872.1 hypothetical protein HDV02_000324 [Globomyces sp. JEL0801]